MRAAAVHISDDDFVIAALNGLPPEYAIIKTVLIARDSPITLKDFRAQLLAAEQTAELRIVHHSGLYAANSSASAQPSSVASGQGLLPTPFILPPPSRGFLLVVEGLLAVEIIKSQFRSSIVVLPFQFWRFWIVQSCAKCQICSKRGHTAANCYFRHAPSSDALHLQAPPSSLTAMNAQSSYSPEQVWIADTGASHHTVGDASQLHNLTSCDVPENDKLTKQIVLQGKSNHSLYHIPLATSSVLNHASCLSSAPVAYLGQQIKSSLWHKRLGHPTNEVVKLMLQASAVSVSTDSVSALCSACLHGKMHRLPFPSEHSIPNIASSHSSDIPSRVSASFGGDPVLIGSSAASIENLQVLNDQQLQVLLPSQESSSPFMPPPMHPMQTRSKSGIVKPKPFEEYQCYLTTIPSLHDTAEPATYKAASQSSVWIQAMRDEIEALHTQGSLGCARFQSSSGLDFSETLSPVVRHTTFRLVLSIAAMNRWSLRQLDVKNAFLHGDLEEEVFMRQPQGFEDSKYPSHVCRLRKSLYGLKRHPELGMQNSQHVGSDSVILLLYVDDIILTGSKDSLVQEIWAINLLLRIADFLHDNGDIFVCQTKYARDLLAKAGMDTCRSCTTPCKPHCQLLASEGDSLSDPTSTEYMTQPSDLHFQLVKRILRYIHGTLDHGLNFTSGSWDLHAYSDADWASDVNTRRSTTGFVKQNSVSRSSTEAEYRALANTAADLAWVRQVLLDLRIFLPQPPTIHCDNLSALALSSNPVYHSRIKHLDIDFHFVRERVQKKDLFVQYIPTEEQ
ncbi:hypothetical protein Prudu_012041, partial [Prunus dulcis]